MREVALVAFTVLMTLSVVVAVYWWFDAPLPIRRANPRRIFRLVHREDRTAYSRIMRRTLAVQMRDLNRVVTKVGREIGKALRPVLDNLAANLRAILR